MILGYDTETSNLPLWKDPSDDPRQPSLMQLALVVQDMEGREVDRWCKIVRPRYGCVMSPEAFNAHGITLERAMDEGVDPGEAFDAFHERQRMAELLVAHNEYFDRRMMRITAAHHRGFKYEPSTPNFCTLHRSKYIINLPPTEAMMRANRRGPKSPSLEEAVRHFFDRPPTKAHDALGDVIDSLAIFRHLTEKLNVPMFKAAA
jgi:DNA polymerase III epsilon subunit-like protein